VLRTPLPGDPRRRGIQWRRLAGTAVTIGLLAASGVVIYLRLHHGPLEVTGVAITRQAKNGCTVDVTALISTNGGAGAISYQWLFTPSLAPSPSLREPVPAGQSGAYVTAAIAGQGHGSLAQTVTLRVLGPGHDSASARVVVSC
jgi:hypothetical protein